MSRSKDGEFVTPGDKIGVIEEYEPGFGTYESDGVVRSFLTGVVEKDVKNHLAVVKPVKEPLLPRPKDVVYAVVSSLSDKLASVMIISVGNRLLSDYLTGMIHIRASSTSRVRSLRELFKPGDIVRCEVLTFKNGVYHLRTQGSGFGVVYAVCSLCGTPLVRSRRELKCPVCGNTERRKTTRDYGSVRLRWLI